MSEGAFSIRYAKNPRATSGNFPFEVFAQDGTYWISLPARVLRHHLEGRTATSSHLDRVPHAQIAAAYLEWELRQK